MPALPKPASDRRRRNLDARTTELEPRQGAAPLLPPLPDGRVWSPRIVAWWAEAWGSEMASNWHVVDVPILVRYVQLWQLWEDQLEGGRMFEVASKTFDTDDGQSVRVTITVNAPSAVLSAMSNIEERFGLSSVARRKLRWEIDPSGSAPDPVVRRSVVRAKRPPRDPRLKVVG